MKYAFLALILVVAPLSAFAGAADCVGAPAPLVKNHFTPLSLATLVGKGGVVRVFTSTRYYTASNLSSIGKAAVDGGKGGKLVLCVDDDYYPASHLTTIASNGAEVVLLN